MIRSSLQVEMKNKEILSKYRKIFLLYWLLAVTRSEHIGLSFPPLKRPLDLPLGGKCSYLQGFEHPFEKIRYLTDILATKHS
jgi:hypothetical protein